MRRIVLLPLATIAVLLCSATPAWAHGGAVQVSLANRMIDGNTATYTVALTYENDGHPVIGSGVAVSASGPGGSRSGSLRSIGATGRYSGSITLSPGAWTVRFVNEEGSLTITQQIGSPATTTTAPRVTTPPTTSPPATTPRPTSPPSTIARRATAPATTAPLSRSGQGASSRPTSTTATVPADSSGVNPNTEVLSDGRGSASVAAVSPAVVPAANSSGAAVQPTTTTPDAGTDSPAAKAKAATGATASAKRSGTESAQSSDASSSAGEGSGAAIPAMIAAVVLAAAVAAGASLRRKRAAITH